MINKFYNVMRVSIFVSFWSIDDVNNLLKDSELF